MVTLEKNEHKAVVLFDFDGTLANTNPLIIETYNQVFKKHFPKLEINKQMELSYIGPTLHHTFRRYLNVDNVDKYVDEYRNINMQMQRDSLSEVDNATNLLKKLKSYNLLLGIVSSKMKDSLMLGINLLNFKEYLDVIVGGDEVNSSKPNPEGLLKAYNLLEANCENKFYVGDTVTDVLAAKAAGFTAIALITTKHFEDEIRKVNPDYIIYDLLEVETIIKEELYEKI